MLPRIYLDLREMFMSFKEKREAIREILRCLTYFILWLHLALLLKDFLLLPLVSGFFLLAVIIAMISRKLKLRFAFMLLLSGLVPLLLRQVFVLIIFLGNIRTSLLGIEAYYFILDRHILILFLPGLLTASAFYWSKRVPAIVLWEIPFQGLILALIFWGQSFYRLSLYPHPAYLSVAVIIFLFLQIGIMVLSTKRGERGAFFPMLLLLLLLLTLSGFLFSRYTKGAVQGGGGLVKPTLFTFDFSQFIRLESEISLKDDLVLLMKKEGPAEKLLLRRYILSGYKPQTGFYREDYPGEPGPPEFLPEGPQLLEYPAYLSRERVLQEYYILNFDSSSLLGMNEPVEIIPYKRIPGSSFNRIYRVYSEVSVFPLWDLSEMTPPAMDPGLYRFYTDYGRDEAVKNLALFITEGAETYLDKVLAVEEYLKENYYYSLKPGVARDGNQLHHFLFLSGKGYCSYFAFSMALLLRSIGIPSRVAVGFWADPDSEILNIYPVRADMAHAWVEVYFGPYGWIEYDPTSSVIAPGEEYLFSPFQIEDVADLVKEIVDNQDLLLPEDEREISSGNAVRNFGRIVIMSLGELLRIWYIIIPSGIVTVILAVRFWPLICFVIIADPREKEKRRFLFLYRYLHSLGRRRKRNESLLEFALRLHPFSGRGLSDYTGKYLAAVFSPNYEKADIEGASLLFKTVLLRIFSQAGWLRGILAIFNPSGLTRRIK